MLCSKPLKINTVTHINMPMYFPKLFDDFLQLLTAIYINIPQNIERMRVLNGESFNFIVEMFFDISDSDANLVFNIASDVIYVPIKLPINDINNSIKYVGLLISITNFTCVQVHSIYTYCEQSY